MLVAAGFGGAAFAADRCVPGQAIVKFAPALRVQLGQSGNDIPGLCTSGAQLLRYERLMRHPDENAITRGLDLQYLLVFDPSVDMSALICDLSSSPQVEYACPNALLSLDSIPNDTLYPEQWHLPDINAPRAWAVAHGDSNVLTAMIADAPYWTHPDLEANIWVNGPEDINGNGVFDTLWYPDGDLDGIDNDGNGYIDDVIGYDFYGGDPFPLPTDPMAVGTHYLGVQNAVTDNTVGVAAPPWNVRSCALRCGDSGSVSLSAAISAIYYCREQGVWAFSMNFGSLTPYQPLAVACLAAWEAGSVPCAPVGHSGGEDVSYPAACEGVVAVAGSGRDHRKTPSSSYGTWVDVTAPGEDIYSTYGPGGYTSLDGNSAACNIVVGVLAWIKSAWPDISNDSAVSMLKNMCDTMPDSLYWAGKLGAGRVRMSTEASGLAAARGRSHPASVDATIVHSTLVLGGADSGQNTERRGDLLDIAGRAVMALRSGTNDVSGLNPGVYFVRLHCPTGAAEANGVPRGTYARKVIVTR
jgi:hypothetical protein